MDCGIYTMPYNDIPRPYPASLSHTLRSLSPDSGNPLPYDLRVVMEQALRADFSDVRIHIGTEAPTVNARAFAYGSHLFFASGEYRPESREGRRMIAHELVHVLQQRAGRARADDTLSILDDPQLEAEANHCAAMVADELRIPRWLTYEHHAPIDRPVIQCIKYELSYEGAVIPGLELLDILDTTVTSAIGQTNGTIQPIPNETKAAPNNGPNCPIYRVVGGADWLKTAGHLSVYITANNVSGNRWFPCYLRVGAAAKDVFISAVTKDHTVTGEIVQFQGQGGDYPALTTRLKNLGYSHDNIAKGILSIMMGYQLNSQVSSNTVLFLSELVALLFGVEGSRNNATFLTSLMLLDLIANRKTYGRLGSKLFSFDNAFQSQYEWDDVGFTGGPLNYGGKFPMASFGTGSGNLGQGTNQSPGRAKMIGDVHANTDSTTIESHHTKLRTENQHHAVVRKEISLVVHWLEMMMNSNSDTEDDQINQLLNPQPFIATSTQALKNRVTALFRQRLIKAYRDGVIPPAPNGNVNPFSGYHNIESQRMDEEEFYWRASGRFYHADLLCKTIPSQYSNEIDQSGTEKHALLVARKRPCTFCCSKSRRAQRKMTVTIRCNSGHEMKRTLVGYPEDIFTLNSQIVQCPSQPCNWRPSVKDYEFT